MNDEGLYEKTCNLVVVYEGLHTWGGMAGRDMEALAAALFGDAGVRVMERGVVSAGRNKDTGAHFMPKLELVRLTLPRRVYTQAHKDAVAESVGRVMGRADDTRGLEFTYEPEYLRFFRGRLRLVAS